MSELIKISTSFSVELLSPLFIILPKSKKKSNKEPNFGSNSAQNSVSVEAVGLEVAVGDGVDHQQGEETEDSTQMVEVLGVLMVSY